MPAVFLTTPGTRASLVSERLRIEIPPSKGTQDQCVRDIPLVDIEHVVVHEATHITMAAMAELLRRNISLVLSSNIDTVLGLCLPPAPNSVVRIGQYARPSLTAAPVPSPAPNSVVRIGQYRKTQDASFALALAVNWVEAKILNSRRVLQRLAANREELEITPHLLALGQLAQNCQEASSLDTLRGYEGTAAGRYFECYAGFFPEHAPFERRSRRPPHNAPNAVLSYAYTLLSAEAEACLHAIGLDPAIGFLHEPADRRPSLALDIIEPFRAPLADAMALDLLTHSVLHPHAHFEDRNGGVYLNLGGRKRFFVAYERRMEREFTSEQHGSRTSLRNELHKQCRAVKKAVTEDQPFEPFLMN